MKSLLISTWKRAGVLVGRIVRNFYFWVCRKEREQAALMLLNQSKVCLREAAKYDRKDPHTAGFFDGKASVYREWSDTVQATIGRCEKCDGQGMAIAVVMLNARGDWETQLRKCPDCGGSGKLDDYKGRKYECDTCEGSGKFSFANTKANVLGEARADTAAPNQNQNL